VAFVTALAPATRRALEAGLAAQLLPHLGPPGVLGTYRAAGDEIDPAAAEAAATALGWKLAFPRVTGAQPLAFHIATSAELRPGFRGIPEPRDDLPPVRPDVLLVPLLAAVRAGNRLGQGGGHFDRTLAALRASGPLLAIGIAWDMQLQDELPPAPWDQPLDAIATPTAFHLAGAGARTAR
jgi:5-formyltetrahydrofolate cyclo-ligase